MVLEPTGGGGPLADVTKYEVASDVLTATLEVIREAGRDGNELFVAWGGHVADDGTTVRMASVLVPKQRCIHSADGVGVIIDGDGLFELNRTLYERGELLAGQAHAHPTRAYHSEADDEMAFVTFPGGLSVVIPDFARAGTRARSRWRWYRLEADQSWRRAADESVQVDQ